MIRRQTGNQTRHENELLRESGFPSPPRVGFPTRDDRFANCGRETWSPIAANSNSCGTAAAGPTDQPQNNATMNLSRIAITANTQRCMSRPITDRRDDCGRPFLCQGEIEHAKTLPHPGPLPPAVRAGEGEEFGVREPRVAAAIAALPGANILDPFGVVRMPSRQAGRRGRRFHNSHTPCDVERADLLAANIPDPVGVIGIQRQFADALKRRHGSITHWTQVCPAPRNC